MSVNVIAELRPHRSSRTKLAVDPKPVADIIAELGSGFPLSQARVCRNGEIVTDFSTIAQDGDTLWIKFVPYGDNEQAGTGMKIGGWFLTIVGAAMAIFSSGTLASVGIMLVGTGIGMISGGTVLMNVNIPSLKDREKPDNDPSIRGGKNQARPHGRIPALFGRHRIYPDLAANPHTSITGNSQYFTQLFCGGYKDCVVDLNSLKLGETPLVEFSQTKDINQILAGADPLVRLEILQNGEASELYPCCVHEDAVNAPLQNEIDGAEPGEKIPGEIIRFTPDNTDAINVDIFLYNGIGKYNSDGGLVSASVEVRASYKQADEPDSAYVSLGFFSDTSNVISGAELKTKRLQITKSGLNPDQYTVKIERVTADSTDSKVIDQVYVGSVRSFKSTHPPIRAERRRDLTVIAMRVMATGRLNGVVDSFNYVAASKIPVHSGSGSGELYWLTAAETRNPAAMLLYALRGRAAQQRVDPGDIDWASFEAFYRWCEDHDYTCNAYLSESVTIAELLRMIGSTARADILRIDSKITVVQDIERPSHVQLFTPKNTKSYSVAMLSADIPDSIALRYIDEEAGYAQSELALYHTPDGSRAGEPETVQKTDLWGVTGSAQVRRIGMYTYACLKNRPFIHTVEVDIEYLLCSKGDWIQYAGDLALTGSVQGRITETLWSASAGRYVGIRVDEPVETAEGNQYAVRLRTSDGTVLLKDVSAVNGNEIYFTEPFEANGAPYRGDVYAFGIRGKEVIDLIITDIQPQADLCATLTCVEYSPAIFAVDSPGFTLPGFENKITPVSGAVDSGVVGPATWRLFVTYHDSEREPPRPAGDGQGGGWHYAHTTQALWQSSKTSESVDSGEWGPPVRIKGERGTTDTVAVYLALSPQSKILETDTNGNILTGLLPFTTRAELFKWNYKIPVADGIPRYPGGGTSLFDPMPGSFVPVERGGNDITFSLAGAPQGVTVNGAGTITVAADAALEDEHSITVKAEYDGETYTALFFIQVKKRVGEARYLGTVDTLPQGPDAVILKGPVTGQVRALQGNYVLAVAGGTVGTRVWEAGHVYQWTGLAWEKREPDGHTDLYLSCWKDGLEYPELTRDTGWFGAVFTRLLFAQQAFIEELQSHIIQLDDGGAVYGGKYLADGGVDPDAEPDARGFWLGVDGLAKLEGAEVSGHIDAKSGTFRGRIEADEGYFTGNINATGGTFNGTIKGTLDARNLVTSGSVTSGTTYLLKGNNNFVHLRNAEDYVRNMIADIPLKTIRLFATGSCTLRLMFPSIVSGGYQYNRGSYAIKVNGKFINLAPTGYTVDAWNKIEDLYNRFTDTHEYTITLANLQAGNTIELYGKNETSMTTIYHFINTTFELRCGGTNPGLIGLLG